jgi:hypothetical protein
VKGIMYCWRLDLLRATRNELALSADLPWGQGPAASSETDKAHSKDVHSLHKSSMTNSTCIHVRVLYIVS